MRKIFQKEMGSVFTWRNALKLPAFARRSLNKAFNKHLFATNVTISLTLSGLGDFLQQQHNIVIQKQKTWDVVRTRQLTCTGVTVGALCHHWYNLLDRKLPGRTLKVVIKKLLVDQLIFSPVCITIFFISFGLFKGGDWDDFFRDIEHRGIRLYTAEWFVWPPAQLVNFYWLPTKYRVLYDNTISLVFDIYTSYICYDMEIKKEEDNDYVDSKIER
ncbi:mpv17-like protein 2 isoform X2 [Penaeus vannamei]|uniref:mpv17-like protein 2 isoform X2 n=1 Tax=Penaeus vannamei TaxID=6689 RepID=UPI00387F45F0